MPTPDFDRNKVQTKSLDEVENVLKAYYTTWKKQYNGELAAHMDDSGFEFDDLLEDLECDDLEECTIVTEFDANFPLDPSVDVSTNGALLEARFNVMVTILMTGKPPTASTASTAPATTVTHIDPANIKLGSHDITANDIKAANKIYAKQTPDLFETCSNEADVMYLLAARTKNNDLPLMQSINDAFTRDRLDAKYNDKAPPSQVQWLKSTDFDKNVLKKQKGLSEKVSTGMIGFAHRICPQLIFNPQKAVDDDPAKIASYIAGASEFIKSIVDTNAAIPPFQVDMTIAVKALVANTNTLGLNGADDDDDGDDDGDDDNDDSDDDNDNDDKIDIAIGDVKVRLTHNNCSYHDAILDDAKDDNLTRPMMAAYNKFRSKLKKSKNKPSSASQKGFHKAFNDANYPQNKRFNIFIDRRKNLPKDEIIFFEPPYNCDTIPSGVGGLAPEWYFESSRKCLIPGIGNNDDDDDDNKDDQKNIDTKEAFGGKILTFSFHVQAKDQIKCYMFWNSQVQRFYPEDIVKAFKFVFSQDQYDKFIKSGVAATIGNKINIVDKQFENFYTKLIKKKKFPDNKILTIKK